MLCCDGIAVRRFFDRVNDRKIYIYKYLENKVLIIIVV